MPLSSRSCFIDSGDLQIDGTATNGLGGENLGSVEISGFVFENALQHSFWATKPGFVTFQNCEWTNIHHSNGPIMLDYFDNFGTEEMLSVSFEDCKFHNNRYVGDGAQTAIITGNSRQNQMKFSRTVFHNNNMKSNIKSSETRTHLIESLGEISIKNSCFVKNKVAAANVAVYKNKLTASEVVHVDDTGGSLCQFASVFENYDQYQSLNPFCISIDTTKTVCDLEIDSLEDRIEPANHNVPFTINALEYDATFENEDTKLEGNCNRHGVLQTNGPDAQNTKDEICLDFGGCHISHTTVGEYLVYRFGHGDYGDANGIVLVDVSVRVASSKKKKFRLELMYDEEVAASKTLFTQGLGYDEFATITWENVPLKAEEPIHSIRMWFVQGNTNFCAIGVNFSDKVSAPPIPTPTPLPTIPPELVKNVPPITWKSLDYDIAYETTPNTSKGDCSTRGDGVDAQLTSDDICINRDNSNCNIGWWSRDEYLIYRFSIPTGGEGMYSIRARAATRRRGRYIHMGLSVGNGAEFWDSTSLLVPNNGNQNFNDVIWESVFLEPNEYSLKLTSSGNTNLCSVAVLLSDVIEGPDTDDDYNVVVPGIYSAMYYSDTDFVDSTFSHQGNCPFRKDTPVDAKINNDFTCKESKTNFDQHCNVAFTDPNEFLVYDFKKESKQDSVKVSLRVASKRERKIRVEIFSSNLNLLEQKNITTQESTSWEAYSTIIVWDEVHIGEEETFKMKVTFLDGQVNFCAFAIE